MIMPNQQRVDRNCYRGQIRLHQRKGEFNQSINQYRLLTTTTMAAASRSIVVSEVLWFLNSQFCKMPKNELCRLMSRFCTFEEVATAKSLLFDFLKAMQDCRWII